MSSHCNGSCNCFYIGFHAQGTWQWSSGEPVVYMNWAPNEPMGAGSYCVVACSGEWDNGTGNFVGIIELVSGDWRVRASGTSKPEPAIPVQASCTKNCDW